MIELIKEDEKIGIKKLNGVREKNDYYRFSFELESDLIFIFDKLDKNVNIEILDIDGEILFFFMNKGFELEIIDVELEEGDYYIWVFC